MKRLCVLLCALLFALAFGAGCEPGPLDDAVRDYRERGQHAGNARIQQRRGHPAEQERSSRHRRGRSGLSSATLAGKLSEGDRHAVNRWYWAAVVSRRALRLHLARARCTSTSRAGPWAVADRTRLEQRWTQTANPSATTIWVIWIRPNGVRTAALVQLRFRHSRPGRGRLFSPKKHRAPFRLVLGGEPEPQASDVNALPARRTSFDLHRIYTFRG